MDSPLLLTATINPQSVELLNLVDPKIRYSQYIENLIRLITQTEFKKFIFCENSQTTILDKEFLISICKFYRKEIEFLSFKGNQELISKFHRSFGDQEIIEYAINNSILLNWTTSFFKLTGRYWIKNINALLQEWEWQDTVFIGWGLWMNTVHTAFFKVKLSYFNQHFYWKWDQLLQPFANKSLERLYYHYIKQSGINMTINWAHPEFSAEWWAGGRMDEYGWRKWKTKIFAKLGIYDIYTTKFQSGDPILKQ